MTKTTSLCLYCLNAMLSTIGRPLHATPDANLSGPWRHGCACRGNVSTTCRFSGLTTSRCFRCRLANSEALVDIVTTIVEKLWKPLCDSDNSDPEALPVVSMRMFIREIMHRSQTAYSTLQTALLYLFQVQAAITRHLLQCRHAIDARSSNAIRYLTCSRRMFLASLMVASKYVQDKTFRNSTWASIAQIPVQEINMAERVFLHMVNYRLYVHRGAFEAMHKVLCQCVRQMTANPDLVTLYNLCFGIPMWRLAQKQTPSMTPTQRRTLQPAFTAHDTARCSPVTLTCMRPHDGHLLRDATLYNQCQRLYYFSLGRCELPPDSSTVTNTCGKRPNRTDPCQDSHPDKKTKLVS